MSRWPVAVVLPMREQVMSGKAGAVALTVAEFGRASRFREQALVLGGTAPGDVDLPYRRIDGHERRVLGLPWPFWRRASERYADAVAKAVTAEGCRLVEVHNRAPLFRRLARRLPATTRLCLHLHNDPQEMAGLRKPAERAAILARASLVYCVSDYIRDRFVEGLAGPLDRVVVLHNGFPPLPPTLSPRRNTILFVGRLIPEKGVDALIEALGHIAGDLPDWQVKIIGRAPERNRAQYDRLLAGLSAGWGERLVWPGFLPHGEVLQAYAEAAITLVPSLWPEPFGRTALEAMAAGSAVIASRAGGLPEILGEAGVLLDRVTPETIAGAILDLARQPERRVALGEAGRARAAERFEVGLLAGRLDAWRVGLIGSES
jgi:UDP-glucose:(glucosyl)LPS alpha-1,2-glucosyltransferase